MKDKIALLLAGLVAGALLSALVPAQAHHSTDLQALNRKISKLQKKTQYLTTQGLYQGPIVGQQVISYCEDEAAATWEQIPVAGLEEFRYLYDCSDTAPARDEIRAQRKLLLRSFDR